MKNFSDFAKETILDGDKISIIDVINEEVEIIGHTIKKQQI